jgi:hypothetical protein
MLSSLVALKWTDFSIDGGWLKVSDGRLGVIAGRVIKFITSVRLIRHALEISFQYLK